LNHESFFPAAGFALLFHLRCCARAAERTARYAAPWKSDSSLELPENLENNEDNDLIALIDKFEVGLNNV
jgi:hypothetical protein